MSVIYSSGFSSPTLCVKCLESVPDFWRSNLIQESDFCGPTWRRETLQLKAHGIARPKCGLLVSSFIDVSSKNRTVLVRQHCVCSVWIQFWTFGEVAGSVGVTVVAYMTVQIVHLKARGIARRESRGLLFVLLNSLTIFVKYLMTVVRQCIFWCSSMCSWKIGRNCVVCGDFWIGPHGLSFGAKLVSCAPVDGGKMVSPPHSELD